MTKETSGKASQMGALSIGTSSTSTLQTVTYRCQVTRIIPLSSTTFQVDLQSPAGSSLEYQAGQYLQLELDLNQDGQPQSLSYSIANSFNPVQPRHLEIFIQNRSEFSDKILKHLSDLYNENQQVKVRLPMGQAFLQTDIGLTHLLIAAGSGIAKIKCITEELLNRQPDAEVKVYWSNKKADEFYLLEVFQGWVKKYKNLSFIPILESAATDWLGHSGYIYEVIEKDFEDLENAKFYLCGSPQMVYGTIDRLKPRGLTEEDCFSDVFEYAPRDKNLAI